MNACYDDIESTLIQPAAHVLSDENAVVQFREFGFLVLTSHCVELQYAMLSHLLSSDIQGCPFQQRVACMCL